MMFIKHQIIKNNESMEMLDEKPRRKRSEDTVRHKYPKKSSNLLYGYDQSKVENSYYYHIMMVNSLVIC